MFVLLRLIANYRNTINTLSTLEHLEQVITYDKTMVQKIRTLLN